MDSLPAEILGLVLDWEVQMCERQKNAILGQRLVCKAFNMALRPYVFKTIQLDFTRFLRHSPTPDAKSLVDVGGMADALYLDMMVVRDEGMWDFNRDRWDVAMRKKADAWQMLCWDVPLHGEAGISWKMVREYMLTATTEEIARLSSVFHGLLKKVPEMIPLLDSLRRYCLNDNTFDETDFRRVVEEVLEYTPNVRQLKLNLPFQVVGQTSRTATVLLATSLACFAKRPEEHVPLETMVLDHVSDTSLIDICHNPIDLGNAMNCLKSLKRFVVSIKRQESSPTTQGTFTSNLWFIIGMAIPLESLCLIGWNIRRDINTRRHCHNVAYNIWSMRSLPIPRNISGKLAHLRNLELKRVDIDPSDFVRLITHVASSLKELYLNQVYLKVGATNQLFQGVHLWIGNVGRKTDDTCWVAEDLRAIPALKLEILRATGLGYDDYSPTLDPDHPTYDLEDPTNQSRSFDQRFVSAVISGLEPTPIAQRHILDRDVDFPSSTPCLLPVNATPDVLIPPLSTREKAAFDAETFQRTHNTTSELKRTIDGYFVNHNEQALKELQNIITVADRGMNMLSAEIDRARMEGEMGTDT